MSDEVEQEIANNSYGEYQGGDTLQIQRFLPGSIERVWQYLTDSKLRSQWLASGEMLPAVGSEFELTWRNDELGANAKQASGEVDSECAVEEHCMSSRITVWEPPRLLAFSWDGSGDVSIELEERGGEVLLTLTHRKLPDSGTMIGVSAGWHAHLDLLGATLCDAPAEPFWDSYARLKASYEQRVAEIR